MTPNGPLQPRAATGIPQQGHTVLLLARVPEPYALGAFVWGDSIPFYISSTTSNSWTVRASGGIRFFSNTNSTVGVQLAPGGNAWSAMSDRNVKENLRSLNPRFIFQKLASLPITEWDLVSQPAEVRHLGPMAQDFKAAFGLGEDDRHISAPMQMACAGGNPRVERDRKRKGCSHPGARKGPGRTENNSQPAAPEIKRSRAMTGDRPGAPLSFQLPHVALLSLQSADTSGILN